MKKTYQHKQKKSKLPQKTSLFSLQNATYMNLALKKLDAYNMCIWPSFFFLILKILA